MIRNQTQQISFGLKSIKVIKQTYFELSALNFIKIASDTKTKLNKNNGCSSAFDTFGNLKQHSMLLVKAFHWDLRLVGYEHQIMIKCAVYFAQNHYCIFNVVNNIDVI